MCISCTNLGDFLSRNLNYSICEESEESPIGSRVANSFVPIANTDYNTTERLLVENITEDDANAQNNGINSDEATNNKDDNKDSRRLSDDEKVDPLDYTENNSAIACDNAVNVDNDVDNGEVKAMHGSGMLSSIINSSKTTGNAKPDDAKSATIAADATTTADDAIQCIRTPGPVVDGGSSGETGGDDDDDDDADEEVLTPTTPNMKSSSQLNKTPFSSFKDQMPLSSSLKQPSLSVSLPKGSIIKDLKAVGVWERDSPISDISASPNPSPVQSSTTNTGTPKHPSAYSNATISNSSSNIYNPNEFKTPISRSNNKRQLKKKSSAGSGNESTTSGNGNASVPNSASGKGAALIEDFASNLLETVQQNGVWEDNDDISTIASTVASTAASTVNAEDQSGTNTPLSDTSNNILSTANRHGIWETDTDGASTVNTSNNSPMSEFTTSPL